MTRLPGLASRLTALCLLLSPSLASSQAPPTPEEASDIALEQAPPDPPPPPVARPGDPPPPPGYDPRLPAPEPRWRLGVSLGAGTSYGHSYVMLGGLVGYELGQGFEAYFAGQYWGGAKPGMGKLTPGLNWYAPIPFRPYVGVYYARWLIGSGLPDADAVGGRIGATLTSTRDATFSAGMVYEQLLGCSVECTAFWPELALGFRF